MTQAQEDGRPQSGAAPAELSTYRPSGRKPDPMVLVEGPAHSGSQWLAADLAASDRIGRAWWLDLDGDAEVYATGNFEVITPGPWPTMMDQLELLQAAACEALDDHGLPPLIVVSSMTTAWRWCQLYAAALAADQGSVKAQRAGDPRRRIDPDPNMAITIPGNLWDEAHKRHREFVRRLRSIPAVVVMTTRAEIQITDSDGRALPGGQDYRIIAHRDLTAASHIWVRTGLGVAPQVISVLDREWHRQHGERIPDPDPKLSLEDLVFEVYGFRPPEMRGEAELPQVS